MKQKKCNRRLIAYELRNLAGNPFVAAFGIVFPLIMLIIICEATKSQVPEAMRQEINTAIFITTGMIIPMAVVLLGHAANYSQELEKDIPVRMSLFGFRESSLMLAKIIAQIVMLTVGLVLYTVVAYLVLDLQKPIFSSALILVVSVYLLGVLFFGMAHGLAGIFKKFGPAYGISMGFYFLSMALCGMMGIRTEQLPTFARYLARLLPMSYIGSDYIEFWQGGSYNFGPLVQSFLFMGAVCGLLLLYAFHRNKRMVR